MYRYKKKNTEKNFFTVLLGINLSVSFVNAG